MRAILIFACLALASCETSDDRFSSYSNEREAYFACGSRAAHAILAKKPQTDPYYLATAAKQLCSRERSAAIEGIMKAHGYQIWRRITQILDESFMEKVIAVAVIS